MGNNLSVSFGKEFQFCRIDTYLSCLLVKGNGTKSVVIMFIKHNNMLLIWIIANAFSFIGAVFSRINELLNLNICKIHLLNYFSIDLSWLNLPLYQNMVPKSCGPWLKIHVSESKLPVFTYKSAGPRILAFASVKEKYILIYTYTYI